MSIYQAIDNLNEHRKYNLQQIDICTLFTLHTARTGIRNKTIMRIMGRRTNAFTFTNCLNRLMTHNLIHRAEHGRSVYYTITLKGKRLITDLNQSLIDLSTPKPQS